MAYSVKFWKTMTLGRCVRIAWVAYGMIILFVGLSGPDAYILIPMMLLSFPLGLIVSGLYIPFENFFDSLFAGFLYLYDTEIKSFVFMGESASDLLANDTSLDWKFITFWLLLFAVGYWQWFILGSRLFAGRRNVTTYSEEEKEQAGRTRT